MPQREELGKRVRELAITSTQRSAPTLAGGTLFYLQQTPPQPQAVLVAQPWPDGKPRVLVDTNPSGGGVAIVAFWPSPSGRYLAYGTAEGGSELTTIRVLDAGSGKDLRDRLPYAGGGTTPQSLAWDADEKGFDYVRFAWPKPGAQVIQFDAQVVHHSLGRDAKRDTTSFGAGYSPIAEYRLLTSPHAAHAALLANVGDGGPAEVYLRIGKDWQRVLGRELDVRRATWVGDRLLVTVFADSPRGRVLAVSTDGKLAKALGQGDTAIQAIEPLADGFLVTRSWGPDWRIEHYDANAKLVREVPLPPSGIGIGAIASESGAARALIAYSGWTQPTRWVEYDAQKGTLRTVFEVTPAADYSRVVAHRIDGISSDGVRIPVTLLALAETRRGTDAPTILTAYGGFGIATQPGFLGANLAWIERGGVFAVANIRGGSEFGEDWHRQGMKLDKQRCFDDFYAAARALIESGWSGHDHLGIVGGSNGGLLMGAALAQHPEQYRAVVAFVGIYDVPRHETNFANGRYNISEFGTIDAAEQLRATLKYSPLNNVQKGAAYPAVLMETGANDPRVAPWQSRKFTAALQAASGSGHPVALLTRMDAGHGIGAPFSQRVGNSAIMLTFFAGELGLGSASAAAGGSP